MIKFIALFIVITILVSACITPAYADEHLPLGDISTEPIIPNISEIERQPLKESYTMEELNAILTGSHNFDIPDGGLEFNSTNFPLDTADASTMIYEPNATILEDDYIIAVKDNGDCLMSFRGDMQAQSYSGSDMFRWEFVKISDGIYSIIDYDAPSFGLRAVPLTSSTGDVDLDTYVETDNSFHWSVTIHDYGNTIYSEATGTITDGLSMCLNGVSMELRQGYSSNIALINADEYVRCTSIGFYYNDCTIGVAETLQNVLYGATPSNASCADYTWFDFEVANSNVCEYNYPMLRGLSVGTTTITATNRLTNLTATFDVEVESLMIYRTRNRERAGFDSATDTSPAIPESLQYGEKSQAEIVRETIISNTDFSSYGTPISLETRRQTILNFFNTSVQYDSADYQTLTNMLDHFIAGSGSDYSDSNFTDTVRQHSLTQSYVNSAVNAIEECISENSRTLSGLEYDDSLWTNPSLRNEHPIVSALKSELGSETLPDYFDTSGAAVIILAVQDWYGCKIEVESFDNTGTSFSGTLRFTFYGHFGLDVNKLSDISQADLLPAFANAYKYRYIMQHWEDLNYPNQPQPFVVNASFTVSFSGN